MAETTLQDIHDLLTAIKDEVRDLITLQRISPDQIVVQEGLSDISRRLGLVQAGEFRAGNGQEPGRGFSGVRIAYPAMTYNNDTWNIVGVDNDVLQVGIRASDGTLFAGAGDVLIDNSGIFIKNNQEAALSFGDVSDNRGLIYIVSGLSNQLSIINAVPGGNGGINFRVLQTDSTTPSLKLLEDPAQAARLLLNMQSTDNGSRFTMDGVSGVALIDLRTEDDSGGATFIRVRETNFTPATPGASNDAFHMYMKDNKLIIQSNNGGTVHYKYLTLNDSTETWVHTLVAP